MFTVTHHGDQYKISTSDGAPVIARSLGEVHLAVNHYFSSDDTLPSAALSCPFCRWVAERQRGREEGARARHDR